uniref:WD repeat domain 90 n=1 Tax=Salarias fasciatus TaxID=181472 RepID=A0A672FSF8_SALFA
MSLNHSTGSQHPYVNIFKHVKVEDWKKSAKEGDVSIYTNKTLKCPVFRIRGPVPANSYILIPKNSNQSLGLTGRFLYLLFKPTPGKYFVVHLDVAAEEGVVVRISFSNMFKEFKSTATWLQFPFLWVILLNPLISDPGLVGPAPSSVRWTCLMLDLQHTLSAYVNRCYSHLKSIRLCANMSVKNVFTTDLFSPAVMGLASALGTGPIPREMSFPVPKGCFWHDLYDHIRFPSEGTKVPFDSIQKDGSQLEARKLLRLLPDPILRLRHIIGFGGNTTKCALWTKAGDAVVYPCHAIIVSMKIHGNQQRFFVGHTDKVSSMAFNGDTTLLASAQTGSGGAVRLWDYHKGGCLAVFPVHGHSLCCLSFSYSGDVLCGVGQDRHNKRTVVVWNTADVDKGRDVTVVAKAHTAVDIHTMKITSFDDTRMVSCGRDNVRLWRVRNGSLRSCPVDLGEYQSVDFTDVAFEEGNAPEQHVDDRTLFASTQSGHIFEIDYSRVAVKNVRRLFPAQQQHADRREKWTFNTGPGIAINSISVSSSFCATGSEDGFLRLWPLDFSAVFLEAEHEGPVSAVCISSDSLQVLSATSTGNLGCLDVSSRGYNTLMRSHTDAVLGFSVDGLRRHLTTASADGTVRIWNMDSLHQLYDFASEDCPCSVAFHPSEHIFSCGFTSGIVRVFDISSGKILAEHQYLRGEVVGLTFSPDEQFMYSADSQGSLALYNSSEDNYSVVRIVGMYRKCTPNPRSAPDALAVSSDSRWLAFVGPSEYTVTIADARSLDELLRVDVSVLDTESSRLDSALKVCFSPASIEHLLVATSANKILWVSARTGRLLREVPKVHKQQCSSLAASEDGRFLLTAGHNAVKVWDYNMQLDVNSQMFIGHSQPIRQLSFTPDQRGVVSVGDAIFLWDFMGNPVEFLTNNRGVRLSAAMPRQTAPLPASPPPRLEVSADDGVGPGGGTITGTTAAAPPPQEECMKLKAVIGYNGNGRGNMVWSPDQGLFAYSCGCVVVVEYLHSGRQRHLQGHSEEISCLAVTNDAQSLASAAGGSNGNKSLICIWDVQNGTSRKTISYHRGAVQCLAFSRDDRFLLSVGWYIFTALVLWSSQTFQLLSSVGASGPIHDAAFSPSAAGQLACVGSGGVYFCFIRAQSSDVDLQVQRATAPPEVGHVEVTTVCYHMDSILFTGTNQGHVCAWDVNTQCCFMTWEADEGEIGVLLCRGNRLLTGSNTRCLRLWEVEAVQRVKGTVVTLEQEIMLDGTTVSAAFDHAVDMGIVGTTAGTLWYISWSDRSSTRLVSGHKTEVNDVVFSSDESHFATCSEDGSVRVWSTVGYELVVQFQVLSQACGCVCWSPVSRLDDSCLAAGYSDGTLRVFRLSSTEMEMKLHPHQVALTAIRYSAHGRRVILSAARNGLVAVSSPASGATIRVIRDHKGATITSIQCVTEQCQKFGLEGNELWLAASADRRVSVWAADWSREKCDLLDWLSFPAPPYSGDSPPPSMAAFCPDDHSLVVYTGYGVERELSFYSLTKKQVTLKIALPHWASCISLSSRSQLVAVGSKERVLKLIKANSGRFQDFSHHSDSLQKCCFSPSGRLLFSVAFNEILLWEVQDL